MIKTIIREVPAEECEFSWFFDDDGLTSAGGDFCNNLFIVAQSRNHGGFNTETYNEIVAEIESLDYDYDDFLNNKKYTDFTSIGDVLKSSGLIDNVHNGIAVKKWTEFLNNDYSGRYGDDEEKISDYLTLKTGKEWKVAAAYGYSQGDYVRIVYCSAHYYGMDAVKYGEVWLGAAREFYTVDIDENGEEIDTCYGYIVADCQVNTDEDYKRIVCEWTCTKEEETTLEMIDSSSSRVVTKYTYKTI